MSWPPKVGEPLPRADDAWSEAHKWSGWILAKRGHGPELRRVLQVRLEDVAVLWEGIVERIRVDPVTGVRDLGPHGLNCHVDVVLTIADRTANIRTVWNYVGPGTAPRLVSAYPRL
jgi:hypothetical protein